MRIFNRGAVVAFFGNVYFPPGLRERLEREDPARLADILDHEAIHVARQHAAGMVSWHLRYALRPSFRWLEEAAAYHSTFARMRARGEVPDAAERERIARELSGAKYLFMTSRAAARAFVDQVFDARASA
jgi:hypothetical protein